MIIALKIYGRWQFYPVEEWLGKYFFEKRGISKVEVLWK